MQQDLCHEFQTYGKCSIGMSNCEFRHVIVNFGSDEIPSIPLSAAPRPAAPLPAVLLPVAPLPAPRVYEDPYIDVLLTKESPLQKFFNNYPEFNYDSNKSATVEFYRMCDFLCWKPKGATRLKAHEKFKVALTKQFNIYYGTDATDVNSWQSLCARIGVDPIPVTLEECREIVLRTHVNLVDLVDAYRNQRTVTVYATVDALSRYTKKTGKFFSRQEAHAGELLKCLLRHILEPSKDKDRYARVPGGREGTMRHRQHRYSIFT